MDGWIPISEQAKGTADDAFEVVGHPIDAFKDPLLVARRRVRIRGTLTGDVVTEINLAKFNGHTTNVLVDHAKIQPEPLEVFAGMVNPVRPSVPSPGVAYPAPYLGKLPADLDRRIRRGHVQLQGDGIAHADGNTPDDANINALIRELSAGGGGVIHAEATAHYYALEYPLVLHHGVQIVGDGYGSFFKNVKQGGPDAKHWWETIVFLAGTYGGHGGRFSFFRERYYAVNDVPAGARRVTPSNPADISEFEPGDLVALYDPHKIGDHHWRHMTVTEIVGKDPTTNSLVLQHHVADHYRADTTASTPVPVQLGILNGGRVPGLDGPPAFCAKHVGLHNLRGAQSTLRHRDALHVACYESRFSHLWLTGAKMIAGNPCSRTVFENIRGEYGQGALELAQFAHNVTIRGFHAHRSHGSVDNGADFQLNGGGADVVADDIHIGTHRASLEKDPTPGIAISKRRVRLTNFTVVGASSDGVAVSWDYDNNLVANGVIVAPGTAGLRVAGIQSTYRDIHIRDVPGPAPGVVVVKGATENVLQNITIGLPTEPRRPHETIEDRNGPETTNRYIGNVSMLTQQTLLYPEHTGVAGPALGKPIRDYVIPVGSAHRYSVWRIRASGGVGTSKVVGNKTIRLMMRDSLECDVVAEIELARAHFITEQFGLWLIEGELFLTQDNPSQKFNGISWVGSAAQGVEVFASFDNRTKPLVLRLRVDVMPGVALRVHQFEVIPLNDQFQVNGELPDHACQETNPIGGQPKQEVRNARRAPGRKAGGKKRR